VIPFARTTRTLDGSEGQKPWKLKPTAGEEGRATDLESAIREPATSLPAGLSHVSQLIFRRPDRIKAAWHARPGRRRN